MELFKLIYKKTLFSPILLYKLTFIAKITMNYRLKLTMFLIAKLNLVIMLTMVNHPAMMLRNKKQYKTLMIIHQEINKVNKQKFFKLLRKTT